ncbi:FAD/NAD(P)-binding protein, partial [Streptomyces beijiangensis]
MKPSVVIVGAGPRGTGFLERLAANSADLYGDRELDIHLVDPFPPGGGRIWREEQSPLLWMNSMAEDVTMFTDSSSKPLEGPVRPGPTLAEWAGLDGQHFPDRRAQGAYLRWVYEQAVAALPPTVTVRVHRTRALRVSGPRAGRQQVWLEGRDTPLDADLVMLTVGHLDAELDPEQAQLADFAERHGLIHLPPDFTADDDRLTGREGGEVGVRGEVRRQMDQTVPFGEVRQLGLFRIEFGVEVTDGQHHQVGIERCVAAFEPDLLAARTRPADAQR